MGTKYKGSASRAKTYNKPSSVPYADKTVKFDITRTRHQAKLSAHEPTYYRDLIGGLTLECVSSPYCNDIGYRNDGFVNGQICTEDSQCGQGTCTGGNKKPKICRASRRQRALRGGISSSNNNNNNTDE